MRKVPRGAIAAVHLAAVVSEWEPPSEPRQPRKAGEPCPECGKTTVLIDPRGITRWCPACPVLVTPPGVLAPYERGTEVTRAATSQRERDDDAKKTVLVAGEFLRRVRVMLADPRIHPASADLLTWYEEEITDARKNRDGRRLEELAGEFGDDRASDMFRRLHWWQGQPAELAAGYDDEDDNEGYAEDDNEDQGDEQPAAVLATPSSIAVQQHRAQPRPMTWADAFAMLGWRLSATTGGCQVVDERGRHCAAGTSSPPVTDGRVRDGWVCIAHYESLATAIGNHNRRIA
jgi:hypothetical protein